MIITRKKIGDGSEQNPYRPDMDGVNCTGWQVIEEREDEFDVEVFGYEES